MLAAPLLAKLGAAFPNVHFHVAVGETDDLVQRMLSGAVDLAVINPVPDDRLFYRHLVVEDLVLVGGPASDLSPQRPVRFTDLAGLPLVMPGAQTGIRNTLENTALRVNVAITARYSTDSLEVSKHLVAAGLGYAVLPRVACGVEVDAGRLRYAPICEPEINHSLGVAVTAALAGAAPRVRDEDRDRAARGGGAADQIGLLAGKFVPSPVWDPNSPEPRN